MANKKIDESWKAQVRAEKEKLAAQPAAGDLVDPAEAENIFLHLVENLFMRLQQSQHPEDIAKIAKTLQVLYQKTSGNLSSKEQMVFQQIIQALQPLFRKIGGSKPDSPEMAQTPPTPFS